MPGFSGLAIPVVSGERYYREIDFIKAVAVMAVVVLHSLPVKTLYRLLAPFHVWHAVPLFMVVAGVNSALSASRQPESGFRAHYSGRRLLRYGRRLLAPFFLVWLLELAVLFLVRPPTPGKVIFSFFAGGFGPGSYFIPIFVQHLLFFPLFLQVRDRCRDWHPWLFLLAMLGVALFFEYLCVAAGLGEKWYRLLYGRYFFAAVLGDFLVSRQGRLPFAGLLAVFSCCYILAVSYGGITLPIVYPAWGFQHAPAYFYTLFLFAGLWRVYGSWAWADTFLLGIGRASYHIFLVQMAWFWLWGGHLRPLLPGAAVCLLVNLAATLALGYGFYRLPWFGGDRGQAGRVHDCPSEPA